MISKNFTRLNYSRKGGKYGNERFESSKAFVREQNNRIARNKLELEEQNVALVLELYFKRKIFYFININFYISVFRSSLAKCI